MSRVTQVQTALPCSREMAPSNSKLAGDSTTTLSIRPKNGLPVRRPRADGALAGAGWAGLEERTLAGGIG
jgi:hypothetical protein